MLYALSKLIAVPTVSDEYHRERSASVHDARCPSKLTSSCRQGAHLLKKILQQLGAVSEVVSYRV
jgi:di- and tripeptidase